MIETFKHPPPNTQVAEIQFAQICSVKNHDFFKTLKHFNKHIHH